MLPLLALQNLAVTGRLAPLSGHVLPGAYLHLVGPNGAGKSTLLACMAGLHPHQGACLLSGQPVSGWPAAALAHQRAWLSQQQVAPFAMPVWHYLSLHQPRESAQAVMLSLARALGLEDKLTRQVSQLSGGEWQRVRLAACVLQIHPGCHDGGRLLLLDEPMAGLDVAQQAAVDRVLGELHQAGITIVLSSHDLNHTLRHASQVWLLKGGVLLARGEPGDVLSEDNLTRAYGVGFRHLRVDGYNMVVPVP
ncbi:vitamin B12 ABC transporter ATP-binding protein BtuD [Shimwellia blattae]|uniref:Vitamin B12 import ATP-binding protein BtuD n=1 Tax=Shimwellia blattae (strain ATCC 29907 / DSM 4481 / JCM 1650 / NBRC 105725 / CDC 9005-74) TaxID=630626 RepID=I2B838_SHIBC|nr:vitamin B12 ABC transporter ATP-binding protein BtuD [Shimwellia blattae]AFJ46692.1 vitamin B12 import ATP-binding protein BtuD [Shimwellia blattae DSM 4481 = NBRC 105725]GAB80270.1 vitamin B12 ABC transporter ATP-binding protein [Shimwellia blattae DSM 4481 = NBRC 105725]VDY64168.1 Vitamin B12 import ATP-binding protein BtuD [Shimwellia blattae]VEC22296.1 Vitamin B12 import ATP-binding protein BtuD [Shimwellia blattae]